jgi:hypothetical protein
MSRLLALVRKLFIAATLLFPWCKRFHDDVEIKPTPAAHLALASVSAAAVAHGSALSFITIFFRAKLSTSISVAISTAIVP